MGEPPELRVSDADREGAVARLRVASGEGRLTFEELAARVEAAYASRTAGELAVLTEDLPATAASVAPAPTPATAPEREGSGWVVAVMGGAERRARWRPWRRTHAVAIMGGVNLDLREAGVEAPEIDITAVAIMGGVDVIVPEGMGVDLRGLALMGGNAGPRDAGPGHRGAPMVRVRAYSLMGGVRVKRRGRLAEDAARG